MKPADLVEHPTGGIAFGVIPPISAMSLNLAEARVYVKVGQHHQGKGGRASGHGLLHIWHGKKAFLRKRGIKSPDQLAVFIASLMARGTEAKGTDLFSRAFTSWQKKQIRHLFHFFDSTGDHFCPYGLELGIGRPGHAGPVSCLSHIS